jgi:UDP-GlcNAc:undecaprenyl-phosphate GlcNAc-1-phosphate transferase
MWVASLSSLSNAILTHWLLVALPFISGFLAAVILTILLIKIAPRNHWLALPRHNRWNKRAVAKFGGIPILIAFSVATLLRPLTREAVAILLLTWGMGVVGLVDDVVGLGPRPKLLGQITLAGLAVSAGIVHRLSGHFWLDVLFTIVWIVGITNAFNLLDNMDGLAAGIAIIGLVQVILLAGPEAAVSGLVFGMLVAVAGFLPFNFYVAKVFMGDTGALMSGFFLACTSIKAAAHLSSLASLLFVPCLVTFIPVFDMLLVSVTRGMNGRAIYRGATDHASHRLVLAGLSERQAVLLLYTIAMIAGGMALLWKASWADLGAGLVALFLIAATVFWVYLAKLQLPESWLSPGEGGSVTVPRSLQQLVNRTSIIVVDAALVILGLYFAYVLHFGKLDEVIFGRFLFASALSVAIKLTLLIGFGAYQKGWRIDGAKDVFVILKASGVSAILIFAAALALPQSKRIESSIILADAVLTSCLLVLCHLSARIFDGLLSKLTSMVAQSSPLDRSGQNDPAELDASQRLQTPANPSRKSTASHP